MRRLFALFITLLAGDTLVFAQSGSPYESSADFARYAMKLREQAMTKINNDPQVLVPTTSRPVTHRFPWKRKSATTVFWIGEQAGGNNPVPNFKSSWDANWPSSYGGFDKPDPGSR